MVIKTKQANAKHIFNQWWQCAVLLITEQTCYDSNVLRGFWIRFSSNQFFFSFAFVLFVSHRLCFYSWFDFFFRCSLLALTTANTLSTIYLICWYERFDLIWIEHLHFCFFSSSSSSSSSSFISFSPINWCDSRPTNDYITIWVCVFFPLLFLSIV